MANRNGWSFTWLTELGGTDMNQQFEVVLDLHATCPAHAR